MTGNLRGTIDSESSAGTHRETAGEYREAAAQLSSASAEILAGTTEQAAGAQEQAAAVAQTVTPSMRSHVGRSGGPARRGVGDTVQKTWRSARPAARPWMIHSPP